MSAIKTVLVDTIGDLELREQDDGDGDALFVRIVGTKTTTGSAWGPATDGAWFAWRFDSGARRVESRAAAIAYITTTEEAAR